MKFKTYNSGVRFAIKAILSIVIIVNGPLVYAQSAMDCSLDGFADDFMKAYEASERLQNVDCYKSIIITKEEALLQQQKISRIFENTRVRIGYKAGVIDKPTQDALGIDAPIFGTLYKGMILPNGSSIDTKSAPSLLYEGDMLVRVSNEAINQASTIEDVAANIDQLIAFVEAPSRMYPLGARSSGHVLAAMNSIARLGVMGEVMPASTDTDFLASLGSMQVTVKDSSGNILKQGNTADVPHPLLGVLFVRDILKGRSERLKAGDLISLGSFTEPMPAQAGMDLTVSYEQLGGRTLTVRLSYK